jgi:molybdopterin converting factor subunit 1
MTVTVRLFARLREIVGAAEVTRQVATGSSVQQIWRGLADEFPPLAEFEPSISAAVNAEYAKMSTIVAHGDEIAFLPPVSGG